MDSNYYIEHICKKFILLSLLICVMPQVSADEALGSTIDCSEVEVQFVDNPEWTRSERIEAMHQAFFESLNRFELCSLSKQSSASSTVANQASAAENELGTDSAGNNADHSEGEFKSTASPLLAGTESEESLAIKNNVEPLNTLENTESNIDEETVAIKHGGVTNGKVPDDIPNANNDDVVAAQIRLAAEIEKDPVKKEKLWNEYRKYKGLPVNLDSATERPEKDSDI